MKVLVIAHGHPEFSRGGAETAAYNLHKGLLLNGVESTFLARSARSNEAHLSHQVIEQYNGGREYFWNVSTSSYDTYTSDADAAECKRFINFVRDVDPEVVHFHHYFNVGSELIYLIKRHLPYIRIVLTLHEFLAICARDGQMYKTNDKLCFKSSRKACVSCIGWGSKHYLARELFFKNLFRNIDRFVSPSHFLKERYVDWGLDAGLIDVIENAHLISSVPVKEAGETRAADDSDNAVLKLGYFGQITPYKGLEVLLKAIAGLSADVRPRVRLYVYGANLSTQGEELRSTLMSLIEETADVVSFQGQYEPEQLPVLMSGIDVMVIPSKWWENSPMVIQEAFANGVPVIASNIGGMLEKVNHEVDGLHFNVGDSGALGGVIGRLLSEDGLLDQLRSGIRMPAGLREIAQVHMSNVYGFNTPLKRVV
ncbi:glycosyltransferase family 4 protein [Granulosicoccaceae sp. 1_MG-2023]|nr:glycosyltransferase family 4 protein [Granulosicoccaceae sp. 1_MG-2023]